MSLKISLHTIKHVECSSFRCNSSQTIRKNPNFSLSLSKSLHRRIIPSPLSIRCNLSIATPPKSKEDAIRQVKTCLTTTLQKPLNNFKLAGKSKKLKQPRFRVEVPVIDESPGSLSQLALDVFGDVSVRRKGPKVKTVIVWTNDSLKEAAVEAFRSKSSDLIQHITVSSSTDADNLNAADVAVFLAPDASQLEAMEAISDKLYPRPVVIFNPKWSVEEEKDFGRLSGFVGSFEVIYSFMGLEVRGLLSKKNGVVFKCVKDGMASGEKWSVFVEEEGDLKVVSTFKKRPAIDEVENVLYNMMAINSPITKSVQFFKGLVSNVTGKK